MMMLTVRFDDADLLRASDTLKAHDVWTIFTHRKSDGDAVGSACALFEAGTNAGKIVSWYSPDKKLPETYTYLPHFNDFQTCEDFTFTDDGTLYVFLDCATEVRSVSGYDVTAGINALNIDHHEDDTLYARVNCVDGLASSTCEMLYRVFTSGGWEITPRIAECLYTGIFTDTGGFTFSNTRPLTHRIAAELFELGVKPEIISDHIRQNKSPSDFIIWAKALERVKVFGHDDIFAVSMLYQSDFDEAGADMTGTEGLSQMFMTLRTVKFIAVATQYPEGIVRLSIRSREGSPFGAGEFARDYGGGGHERAAGCTFPYPAECVIDELEASIMRKYHECCCAGQ
ncbi:MAG: DHH family phosphoesterase [Synergistaceae bacterium]|nr:DHH family phosphoesterase [Synergistaceae bacterium]